MKKSTLKPSNRFILPLFLILLFSSCYSVRLISRDGIPEPDSSNDSPDFYKNKKVTIIDTTVRLNPVDGSFSLLEKCGTGGFYSIEYRTTLGHVLLSGITLGKVRKVKVKYVCLKQ